MSLASKWVELEMIIRRKVRRTQENKRLVLSLIGDF